MTSSEQNRETAPGTCDPDRPMTPSEIAHYCPACDPCFPTITTHSRACVRARTEAVGLAGILVTQDGQLCSGGREPIERGARAYEDAGGWVWCPEHIPGPEPANG